MGFSSDPAQAEPYSHVVKVRLTTSQLNHLDMLAANAGISRAFLMRQLFDAGVPGHAGRVGEGASAGRGGCGGVGRTSSACHASPWVALLLLESTPVLSHRTGARSRHPLQAKLNSLRDIPRSRTWM